MREFNLFEYLGKQDDKEATIYRCGYYIINKNCNIQSADVTDTFYSILDNMFLKFDMMEVDDIQYFNIYKVRNLSDKQIQKISCLTLDLEDIREDLIDVIIDIENFKMI